MKRMPNGSASDRPTHAVGGDDQRDAVVGAGLDVDAVVADAEAGHDPEPAVGRDARARELRHEEDQRVAAGEAFGWHDAVHRIDEHGLDRGVVRERGEVEAGVGGAAVGLPEVAAQRHLEAAHPRPPQPERMSSTPALTAAW
jgi:hypothetical protein